MINRGRTQSSAYVFNSKTGKLEKQEKNVNTIESLTKQNKNNIKNLEQIALQSNQNTDEKPVNSIVVITAQDNLIHNYFTDIEVSWDAINCLSTAIIKMPKLNTENLTYWTSYTGQLTIYVGNDFTFDYVNTNSHETEQGAANALVKYWDNSNIKPFFRGEISRVKEFDNDITIYVDSIGRRFQQKIPEDFRQSFINNQNVRDAFQAICEFLGVEYICPPKTVTDNGETTTDEQTPSDGTENDVSTQQNTEKNIQNTVKNKVEQQQSNTSDTENNNQSNNNTENLENNEEIPDIQNGYGDINFDANGAIVHGGAIIESSPDMTETLIAMDENPLEQYLEDETGIIDKVQKFLDGDMFEETHNKVMDYGAITIEPKSASSSTITPKTSNTNTNTLNGDSSQNSLNNSSSNSSSNTSQTKHTSSGVKGVWGKTNAGSFYLTADAINKMSMAEAKRRYEDGQKRNIYTRATMEKLWFRMMFGTKFF